MGRSVCFCKCEARIFLEPYCVVLNESLPQRPGEYFVWWLLKALSGASIKAPVWESGYALQLMHTHTVYSRNTGEI